MNITKYHQWTQDELSRMSDIGTIKYLVVHHTESGDVSVDEIDRWHKNNGWVGIGYQYLIRYNGNIEKGRPDNKAGAHAEGYNSVSLGISLCGDFTSKVPTAAQMNSLVSLLTELKAQYPDVQVVEHRDLCATSCPGNSFPWEELQERLKGDIKVAEEWKLKLVQEAKDAGLISSDHNPDETATKWFVLRVALAVLKQVKGA